MILVLTKLIVQPAGDIFISEYEHKLLTEEKCELEEELRILKAAYSQADMKQRVLEKESNRLKVLLDRQIKKVKRLKEEINDHKEEKYDLEVSARARMDALEDEVETLDGINKSMWRFLKELSTSHLEIAGL